MDCGDAFAKILLFVFNLIVFLCGIAIIILGTVLITAKEPDYVSLIGYEVWNICIALIVVGCVITVVSFFGCCGAIKENTCMLYTFSAILSIIFVAELACVIVAFIYQGDIENDVKDELQEHMPNCVEPVADETLCNEWFNMQDSLDCCGAYNATDWAGNYYPDTLPESCCASHISCTEGSDDLYEGCVDKVVDEISPYVWIIAGVMLGIAVIQLIGIGIACCLGHSIKRQARYD